MRLSCGICLSSRSDARAQGTDANEDWVAVTDCGHVYHNSCLSQWTASKPDGARTCPCKCAFRNVKCDKRASSGMMRRSGMQEPMPTLKLYLTSASGNGAPSSDAVLASDDIAEEEDVKPPRKRLRPSDKGKARAEEESSDDAGIAGPSDETSSVDIMRRQWSEALMTVRQQRAELTALEKTLQELNEDIADQDITIQELNAHIEDLEDDPPRHRRRDAYCDVCATREEEGLDEDIQELQAALEDANASAQSAREEARDIEAERVQLLAECNALRNDFHTARIKWREAEVAYEAKLEQSGQSGVAMIEQLRARLGEREDEITHLKASIDGIRYQAEEKTKAAQAAATKAEHSASAEIMQAAGRVKAAEASLAKEVQSSKRYAAANKTLQESLDKCRRKYKELRHKRHIVGSDSDADDADGAVDPPVAASTSRSLARTDSSRSQIFSLSPPASPTAELRINNNSTLLGNSPRKQRHSRNAFDDWDLSREEDRENGRPEGRGDHDDDDDELEYVDIATNAPFVKPVQPARAKATNPNVIELSDDDSELDVVSSSFFRRPSSNTVPKTASKGKGKAVARPSASASSSTSSSSSRPMRSQNSAGPLATLTNSMGTHEHPLWKKAAATSSSKQDKYLPDFTKGRVDTGVKRHVKRK
ncbi:hypothetical protein JCM10908_004634 [Rhodotorula pacifica]|uniref:uncharacterized protein n=1 Tax=Rhodotorula pacifica TaxID=1495444 RepID=UPI0031724622